VNTTLSPAATYVDAVHVALADLPADDLADIIEDVRDHVEQVSAELGEDATTGALEERLGQPADYAAELRSAAGYPPALTNAAAPGRPTRSVRWLATWSVRVALVLTTVALLDLFFTVLPTRRWRWPYSAGSSPRSSWCSGGLPDGGATGRTASCPTCAGCAASCLGGGSIPSGPPW
jgi:hypothetical protein